MTDPISKDATGAQGTTAYPAAQLRASCAHSHPPGRLLFKAALQAVRVNCQRV